MSAVYLITFVICTLLSFILTRRVRNLALARGWASVAISARHIHQSPIPRLGGVAIYIAFICVVALSMAISVGFSVDTHLVSKNAFWILGAATVVFLLGLYDDVYSAPPAIKFLVQGLAAVMLYLGGFGIFQAPLSGAPLMGWLSLPLTVVWVLWITNAFNLIDGIDGLAAGSALFSTLAVFVVSLASGNGFVAILSLALAGAIIGFLRFNFNPATIFLGDSGSLFIGFMLSALALAGAQKSSTIVAVAIPIVSFGLPILETLISVLRRFMSGQPVFAADRGHIHHKLLNRMSGEGAYAWQKQASETSFERSHLPAWSLKLDLIDAAQEVLGAFTVYRACNGKPLLVDINLLTTEFRASLATAVVRVTERRDERLLNEAQELIAGI